MSSKSKSKRGRKRKSSTKPKPREFEARPEMSDAKAPSFSSVDATGITATKKARKDSEKKKKPKALKIDETDDCDFVDGSPSQRCQERRIEGSAFCAVHDKYISDGCDEYDKAEAELKKEDNKEGPQCTFCDGLLADSVDPHWKCDDPCCSLACHKAKGPICKYCGHCSACAGGCVLCAATPGGNLHWLCDQYCMKVCQDCNKAIPKTQYHLVPRQCQSCYEKAAEKKQKELKQKNPNCAFCTEDCRSKGTITFFNCSQCSKALGFNRPTALPGVSFCCDACETEYRATHLIPKKFDREARKKEKKQESEAKDEDKGMMYPCTVCNKEVDVLGIHWDDDFGGDRHFCSKECADKFFERDLLPKFEARQKRLGLDKRDCDMCGETHLKRELIAVDGGGDVCQECAEDDPNIEWPCSRCKKKVQRGHSFTMASTPMEIWCSERCRDLGVASEPEKAQADEKKDKKKARVKHTQVECNSCGAKVDLKDAVTLPASVPGEHFCSVECLEEREHQLEKARTKASGKTKYRDY